MPGTLAVTTAAKSSQLTTLATARAEIDVPAAMDDAALGRLIDRASAALAGLCGRAFGAQAVTETFRPAVPAGYRPDPLILTLPPSGDVQVTADGAALTAGTDFEVTSGMLYRLCGSRRVPWRAMAVVATYSAGWNLPNDPSPNLPADLEDACLSLIREALAARERDASVQRDRSDFGEVTYFDRGTGTAMAVPPEMAAQLAGYVVRVW